MSRTSARVAAGLAVAGIATTGLVALGAPAFADSAATAQPSTTQTQPADAPTTSGQGDQADLNGKGCGPQGGTQDTPVTGDEAQKVKDAVKTKDSAATITEVRKDPDGSYDALGTKADGSRVFYEVSADLATVTENAGGPGHGPDGAPGRGRGHAPGQQGRQGQAGQQDQGGPASAGRSGGQDAGNASSDQGQDAQGGDSAPSAQPSTGGR